MEGLGCLTNLGAFGAKTLNKYGLVSAEQLWHEKPIFIKIKKSPGNGILGKPNDVSVPMLVSTIICAQNLEPHSQWFARVSSGCTSLASPVVRETVDADLSVTAEGTDKPFHLLCIHLALFNKRFCHPSLIYCLSSFSYAVHSTGGCSVMFAQIPWPQNVNQSSLRILCHFSINLNK